MSAINLPVLNSWRPTSAHLHILSWTLMSSASCSSTQSTAICFTFVDIVEPMSSPFSLFGVRLRPVFAMKPSQSGMIWSAWRTDSGHDPPLHSIRV